MISLILIVGIIATSVDGQVSLLSSALANLLSNDQTTVAEPSVEMNDGIVAKTQDQLECICTPFNLCKTYVPALDGYELIDIRINLGPCQSYLDVCCNDTITPTEKYQYSTSTGTEENKDCSCVDKNGDTEKISTESSSEIKNKLTTSSYNGYNKQTPTEYTSEMPNKLITSSYNEYNKQMPTEYTPEMPNKLITSSYNEYNKQTPTENTSEMPNKQITSSYSEYKKKTTTEAYIYEPPITYIVIENDVTTESTKTSEVHSSYQNNNDNQNHECGVWNKNGMGFRIVNAIDGESEYGEYPSMIAIFKEETTETGKKNLIYHCGGSLIKKNVVLTTAHCVIRKDPSSFVVRAGDWDLKTDKEIYAHQDRRVSKIITHSEYYAGGLHNDVALLFVEEHFTLQENIQTICLPEENDNFVGTKCFSSGWGKTVSYNNYTIVKKSESGNKNEIGQYEVSILKKVELPIVFRDKCVEALRTTRLGPKFILHDSFICAGGEEGKDTCKGDGGSPLMCPSKKDPNLLVQVGIVAWGINCGLADIPAVYVDVPHFRKWIDQEIENYSSKY